MQGAGCRVMGGMILYSKQKRTAGGRTNSALCNVALGFLRIGDVASSLSPVGGTRRWRITFRSQGKQESLDMWLDCDG